MQEFTTENGADIVINPADFLTSCKLKKAVMCAVKKSDIDIANLDLDSLNVSAISAIIQAILEVDSSDDVENAIFKCLERCTYNKEKITKDTFEPVEARENYYQIIIACVKANLLPFFLPLFSKLKGLMAENLPAKNL